MESGAVVAADSLVSGDRTDSTTFVSHVTKMDRGRQIAVMQQLQKTRGNQYVQRLVDSVRRIDAPDPQVQRDASTVIGVIGLAMGAVSITQSQVSASSGGLSYDADQMSYPADVAQVSRTRPVVRPAAEFFSAGVFANNHTKFNLYGDFSATHAPPERDTSGKVTNRVMANVYIDMAETSTYSSSLLSFRAKGLKAAYGTPEDPRLRFVCSGRFDPAGPGDCSYRAVLEVNQFGDVHCIELALTNGTARSQSKFELSGFYLGV